jgi:transcription elongation factor GreA
MTDQQKKHRENEFTRKGYEELEKKLEYLITVRRNEIADQIAVARGFGDLSENAEYDEAKKEQAAVEAQINELENIKRTAIIIEDDEISTDRVGIGTVVRIKDMDYGDEDEYAIVGARESDPYANRISSESPVGRALLEAKKGDVVTAMVPNGNIRYKVLDIRRQ